MNVVAEGHGHARHGREHAGQALQELAFGAIVATDALSDYTSGNHADDRAGEAKDNVVNSGEIGTCAHNVRHVSRNPVLQSRDHEVKPRHRADETAKDGVR